MIKKVIHIKKLDESSSINEDLHFWLSKSPEERVSAVQSLRKQRHGISARLQRAIRIIQRT